MRKSLFFLALLAASLAPAQTAKRPMTFEDLQAVKRLGETAVSPDGKWLAYSVTTVNLDQNTKTTEWWLQAISPSSGSGGEPFKLAVTQPGDSGVDFSADGKRILLLSSRSGSQQIWLASFDTATGATGNAFPVAPADAPFQLTHNTVEPENAKWSPNGKFIVFSAQVYPDCPAFTEADGSEGSVADRCNADRDRAAAASKVKAQVFTHLLYRHWNHYTGEKRSHLFIVTLDSPSKQTLLWRDLTPNDPHDVPPFSLGGGGGFAISPDSRELAFTENPDEEQATSISARIYTLDLTNPAAKPVAVSNSAGGNFNPAYSPDGKYLAWRSEARAGYEADKFRLFLYDRAAKTIKDILAEARLVGGTPLYFDRWVDEFIWSDMHDILFTAGDRGQEWIINIELLGGGLAVIGRGAEFSSLHETHPRGQEFGSIVVSEMKVDRPSEVVSLSMSGSWRSCGSCGTSQMDHLSMSSRATSPESITHLNDALLSQLDLPAMEPFWFTAADKTKLQGFVIRPPAFDPAKKYPLKFLIHGGPQGAWGDAWSYRWNAELFAANGYVVVMINPRGSTGYGQAVVDGVNGDWGGKPFTDLITGLDYAEQHYPFIDKTRECALGASYGGYMANWILGHTTRFRCIVSHDGMFNAESAFGSTEEDWFNQWEFKGNPWDYYGKPDAENPFRKWSPSLYAKNFKTPTLVIHGQLDYRLDVSEGFQLFDTLQLLKVPSKMLYFPDEGHWVLKPQNSRLWYKTVNDWVDQWTKPRD